jgi:hypothetical protein
MRPSRSPHTRLGRAASGAIILLVAIGLLAWQNRSSGSRSSPGRDSGGRSADCYRPYSRQSPWNTPIPAGATSAPGHQLIGTIAQPLSSDPTQYTYPVYESSRQQSLLPVYVESVMTSVTAPNKLHRSSAGTQLRIPIAPSARPAAGSDGHLILLDHSSHAEWGFWQFSVGVGRLARRVPAGSGSAAAPMPVENAQTKFSAGTEIAIGPSKRQVEYTRIRSFPDSDRMIFVHATRRGHAAGTRVWGATAVNAYQYGTAWTGVPPRGFGSRGAGVPYLAGLVRRCEIARGQINHALAFAYPNTTTEFVYPARKSDGQAPPGKGMPEGARLQLDPSVRDRVIRTSWGCTNSCFTIAKALQRYGMYLVDSSGRPKILVEDQDTAHWRGPTGITSSTVSRIPVSGFKVLR